MPAPSAKRPTANKVQRHLRESKRELARQLGTDGVYLKPGGTVHAARMLNKAIQASYLPPEIQREQITLWAGQVKKHWLASELVDTGWGRIVPPQKRQEIEEKAKKFVKDSLRRAELARKLGAKGAIKNGARLRV